MPTQNRRVATYLPPHIDEPFKAFKFQRDIKGDSEALIAILSEYFQVSQEVAYSSSSNLLQRIEAVEDRLSRLKSELLSELKAELQKPSQAKKGKDKSESLGESQSNLLLDSISSEQLNMVHSVSDNPKLSGRSTDGLSSMTGSQLSKRFNLADSDGVAKSKSHRKNSPEKFAQWLVAKDPDGISWEYHEDDKLYHPVLKENPLQYS